MKTKGFTLIEALIVATIFSFIAAGIAASFVSGMKLWGRAQDLISLQGKVLLGFELMSRELRQSVDFPDIGFKGTSQEVSFPALIYGSIVKVTYKFSFPDNAVIRREVELKDIISGNEEKEYREKKVLSAEEFRLSYLYFDSEKKIYSWTDSWESAKGKFSAVKLYTKNNDAEFERSIFIPVSM